MRIPRPAALRRLLISVFGSLFWRTFMLIALLIAISLGAWFQSFRIFEREPRAQQIAMQIVSVVKLTRAALLSDPARRRFLLLDLVQNEGIKVYPREKEDEYRTPQANPYLTQLVQREIRNRLGQDTVIATAVNDIPGVWVSFQIEGDDYWSPSARTASSTCRGCNGCGGRSRRWCCRCWARPSLPRASTSRSSGWPIPRAPSARAMIRSRCPRAAARKWPRRITASTRWCGTSSSWRPTAP